MVNIWRKPPGRGRLSDSDVSVDRLYTLKNKATPPKKQPGNPKATPSISLATIEAGVDLRFRRQVERLHRLGPRALGELLAEIGEQRLCRTYLEQRVRRYSEIDPKHLAALEGDRFPRPPLYEVAP
ncbi:MAG: hypothetical protein IID48_11075 [Proteobacteria bacterium]|nr:hypothetical protein [Pseudomonadota bacterium]